MKFDMVPSLNKPAAEGRVLTLIFSKDRALQLDGTLCSLALCAGEDLGRRVVLYKASNVEHAEDYRALAREHPEVEFRVETDFYGDVLALLREVDWVLFSVDDTVFVRPFGLKSMIGLLRTEEQRIGVSLRLGKNTSWCFSWNEAQAIPEFTRVDDVWLEFDWTKGELDFGYPLEVSSSFYSAERMVDILQAEEFSNPNEMESLLQRAAAKLGCRFGRLICLETSAAFSIPLNKVQTTFDNRSGNVIRMNPQSLQRLFRLGFRVDAPVLQGFVPAGCHQLIELPVRMPDLGGASVHATINLSLPNGEAAGWGGELPLAGVPVEDAARVLETFAALAIAARQTRVPVVTDFLRRLLIPREEAADHAVAEQILLRERQRHDLEGQMRWLSQQVEAKDRELERLIDAYASSQEVVKRLAKESENLAAISEERDSLLHIHRDREAEIDRLARVSETNAFEIQRLTQACAEQREQFRLERIAEGDAMRRLTEATDAKERELHALGQELRAKLADAHTVITQLQGWSRELEAARDWHDTRRELAQSEVLSYQKKSIGRIAWERFAQRLNEMRGQLGQVLQKRLGLDRPPQVVAFVRGLLRGAGRRSTYRVPESTVEPGNRPGILLFMPFLVLGGAERVLSQIAAALNLAGFEIILVTSVRTEPSLGSAEAWFKPHVREIIDVSQEGIQQARARVMTLVHLSNVRAVWIAGSELAYDLLGEIKVARSDLKVVDVLFNEVGHTTNNRRRAALIDVHLAENRQVAAWLEANGEKRERIRIIPNGVDLQYFSLGAVTSRVPLPKGRSVVAVGYLGRLSLEKGPDLFLEIAAKFRSRPELSFFVAGVGPMETALRARAAELQLEEKVTFLGAQDARSFLAACDVLVIPSHVDGRPNAALEAMAMGLPIVASRVGGLPELVAHDETGWLCTPGDSADFAARIERLVQQPLLLDRVRRAARLKAERELDHRLMERRYVDLFWSLTSR